LNHKTRILFRLGIAAGLVGPPVFAGSVLSLTLLQYDFLRALGWHPLYAPTFDWPSGLALGPYGAWMTGAFVLCGAMMSLFAVALGLHVRRSFMGNRTFTSLGPALLAMAGLALMGLAFTTDPTIRSTPATWHGRLHDGSFVLLGLALLPAMLVLGQTFRKQARWRSLGVYTWLTAASVMPAFVLKGAAFYAFLGAVLVWSEAIAWRTREVSGM
jgi:hypothetical protein